MTKLLQIHMLDIDLDSFCCSFVENEYLFRLWILKSSLLLDRLCLLY